jgi:hypothetical protein
MVVDALATAERIAMDQVPAGRMQVHIVEGEGGSEISKVLAAEFRRMFRETGPEAEFWILINRTDAPEGRRAAVILEQTGPGLEPGLDCLLVHGIDPSVAGVVADFLRTG